MGNREHHAYPHWIEGLEVGIAGVSPTGKILQANARFSQILGIRRSASLRGQKLFDHLAVFSVPDLKAALKEARHHRVEGEIQILNNDDCRIIRASFDRIKGHGPTTLVISEMTMRMVG